MVFLSLKGRVNKRETSRAKTSRYVAIAFFRVSAADAKANELIKAGCADAARQEVTGSKASLKNG